jgi:hypothetical protein
VTFDEALQLLGIARSDGMDSVRPAYLKLLKKYRPERDPDGFKRLRQALELVQAQPYQFAIGLTLTPTAEAVPGLAIVMPGPAAPVRVAPAEPIPLTPTDPLTAARSEIEHADSHAGRLALAEAAARRFDSAEAYALWVEVAEQDDEPDALRGALRVAIDAGHGTSFMTQLRSLAPDGLSADELSVWLDDASHTYDPAWPTLARTLLEQQRGEEAARLARRSLELEAEAGAPVQEWSASDLALDLYARAAAADASAFATRLLALRDPYSRTEPVRYAALAELTRLHAQLGELLTRGIAAALHANEPDAAAAAIELFKNSERRSRTSPVIRLLKREAPTLYALYKPELIAAGLVLRVPTDLGSWRRILWALLRKGWILWALLVVLWVCNMDEGSDSNAKIEIRTNQVHGVAVTECEPQSEHFCRAALRVVREQSCTQAQSDALLLMESAARAADQRLTTATRNWISTLRTDNTRLCSQGSAHP